MPNFPTSLDDSTSLNTSRATGDSIPASDHNDLGTAVINLETKVGSGASVPTTTGHVLKVTGAGATAFGALPTHTHAESDTTSLVSDLAGKQAHSTKLDNLAGLTDAAGVLTNNGSGTLTWGAGGGGGSGQTLYDKIVAPSGGDYTTLSAALAAATAGESIFVRSGSYSESGYNPGTAINNVTIVGENPRTTMLTLTGLLELDGDGWNISGLGFTTTSSSFVAIQGQISISNCYFTASGNPYGLYIGSSSHQGTSVTNCVFDYSGVSSGMSQAPLQIGGTGTVFSNNYIYATTGSSQAPIEIASSSVDFSNNNILANGSGQYLVTTDGVTGVKVANNTFTCFSSSNIALMISGHRTSIVGNSFKGSGYGVYSNAGQQATVSGNSFDGCTNGVFIPAGIGWSVTGNEIYNCTTGIYASTNDNVVNGNVINYATTAVQIDGGSHNIVNSNRTTGAITTGILISSGTSNVVTSNITYGATTGINDSGTTTIIANNG